MAQCMLCNKVFKKTYAYKSHPAVCEARSLRQRLDAAATQQAVPSASGVRQPSNVTEGPAGLHDDALVHAPSPSLDSSCSTSSEPESLPQESDSRSETDSNDSDSESSSSSDNSSSSIRDNIDRSGSLHSEEEALAERRRSGQFASTSGRPGSGGWYSAQGYTPLYEGSDVPSVALTAFLQSWKVAKKISNEAFQPLVTCLKHVLPSGNLLPPSSHVMRAAIDARDAAEYQLHVCSSKKCAGHVWQPLPKSQWHTERDATCPTCRISRRFTVTNVAGREVLEPTSSYIDMRIEEASA